MLWNADKASSVGYWIGFAVLALWGVVPLVVVLWITHPVGKNTRRLWNRRKVHLVTPNQRRRD